MWKIDKYKYLLFCLHIYFSEILYFKVKSEIKNEKKWKIKNKKQVECLNDQRKNTTRSYLSRGLLFLSILIIYNIKEQLLSQKQLLINQESVLSFDVLT